jgi:hypothetical protein
MVPLFPSPAMGDIRMHITKKHWLGVTARPVWFDLTRHADDPDPADPDPGNPDADPAADPEPAEPEGDKPADEPAEPEGDKPDDTLGDSGKKALDAMKRERNEAKKAAADAKRQAADLAKKVRDFEDRDKSELDKATAKAERLATQAAKAVARAVQAEVKALSTGKFADAGDAVDVLMRDPSKYVDADGEIDTDAIDADLTDLLDRKPHWARPEPVAAPPEPKPKPRPDPGQGSRGAPEPTNYLDASSDEVAAELAKVGYRQRVR